MIQGGKALEYYLAPLLKPKLRLSLRKEDKIKNFTQVASDKLTGFYGWLIVSSKAVSRKNNQLMFLWTLKLQWHGLSLKGIEAASKFGLPVTTLKDKSIRAVEAQREKLQRKVRQEPVVLWCDNSDRVGS